MFPCRWWGIHFFHDPGVVHKSAAGQYCDESNEDWAQRSQVSCANCGRPGHMMCLEQLMPGETVVFRLDGEA